MHIHKQKPLVISGCSGVGKGTIITNLLNQFPQLFQLSVSFTTRKPRQGQMDGRQYYFVTDHQFDIELKKGVFLQNCNVHGHKYGTHEEKVKQTIKKGKICLLDIDIQGAEKVYAKYPGWNFVFIEPPSIQELKQRLINRKSQTPQSIQLRTSNAKKQLLRVEKLQFYKRMVNDQIDECYKNIIQFINAKYQVLIQVQQAK